MVLQNKLFNRALTGVRKAMLIFSSVPPPVFAARQPPRETSP